MIVEYIRYKVPAEEIQAFEKGYEIAATSLRASAHCLGYELSRCVEEAGRYILRIEWDSIDGHMNGFRKSDVFISFFSAIKPFVSQIEEMQHYELTPVNSALAAA